MPDTKPSAVVLNDVWKSYGVRKTKVAVLKGVDISVTQGSIYGLLGPSGCGKTTVLRCIVGRLHVDSGTVNVFGHPPGSKKSHIPGSDVGYMPQELALFNELTIVETMRYFGRLNYMDSGKVICRTAFLQHLLNLPLDWRLIKNLSGGQQRRVSFAAALLHEPRLLILDEPTVGVDPLLRENVWQHLLDISLTGNTTIIITTHYIEEARKAHKVGFMRNGYILAEGRPEYLMRQYGLSSLENVFLELCRINGSEYLQQAPPFPDNQIESYTSSNSTGSLTEPLLEVSESEERQKSFVQTKHSLYRIYSLVIKNLIKMWRSPAFLLFQFLIPSIQIILFCLAIGGDPKDLKVAVVNEDTHNLGAMYLSSISKTAIKQINVSDVQDAVQMVKNVEAWGVISIGSNFSDDIQKRFLNPSTVSPDVINGGSIHVRLDMTDQQIGYMLQKELLSAFQSFMQTMLGNQSFMFSSPVEFDEPIYGPKDPHYTEYLAPGVLLSITYFMAVGLTALSFVMERKDGLLDRSYVAGVTSIEVMISHIVTQFGVMIVQITLVLVFLMAIFEIVSHGPLVWIICLAILQGTCGMTYGFLISTICDHENSAIMLSLGSFYPNMLLSGIIWPIEAMPNSLQYISMIMPQTYATEALRCVFSRGLGILSRCVWEGFLITAAWIIAFLLLSALVIKVRH